jgi:hypothetical protein
MNFLRALGSFSLAITIVGCHGEVAVTPFDAGTSCLTVGGTCTPYACAKEAPDAAQDCFGMDSPTCCLELAVPMTPDGGVLLTPEGGVTCADRITVAGQVMAAEVATASAQVACGTDEDCLTVPTATECSAGCNVVVNKAGAMQISSAVEMVEQESCQRVSWPATSNPGNCLGAR